MQKILVIDSNYIMMRSNFAFQNMHRSDGKANGILFGLANTLKQQLKKRNPDYVIFTFDVGKSKARLELSPIYKATRKKEDTPEVREMYSQMKFAQEMVRLMGFEPFIVEGCEADDCASKIVKDYQDQYEIELLSNDKDWAQLLDQPNVSMIQSKKHQEIIYNREAFIEEWGIEPHRWPEVAAMTGDTSDNVIGVKGVGNKTALKFLKKHGDLWTALENEEKLKPFKEQCLLNYKLTHLDGSFCGDASANLIPNEVLNIRETVHAELNNFLIEWELWDFFAFVNNGWK